MAEKWTVMSILQECTRNKSSVGWPDGKNLDILDQ
nr:MAG TPA: putative secreted protein [Caudoviricetes sp.]